MKHFKKSCALSILMTMLALVGYMAYEPSMVDAQSANDTVIVTLNVTAGISISSPSDTTMSTALGVSQHSAVGTTTWNVKTNAAGGYQLEVNATGSPAMTQAGGTPYVDDYQKGAPNTWNATSGNAYFGFSAFGTDVPTGTWGTGSVCNGGSNGNATSTTLKYKGFATTTVVVASRASTTTPSGVDSVFCYAVEQVNFYVPSGTYRATIVATATAL